MIVDSYQIRITGVIYKSSQIPIKIRVNAKREFFEFQSGGCYEDIINLIGFCLVYFVLMNNFKRLIQIEKVELSYFGMVIDFAPHIALNSRQNFSNILNDKLPRVKILRTYKAPHHHRIIVFHFFELCYDHF